MLNELWNSDAARWKKLRDKLQAMTDQQLFDYGRDCGEMCAEKKTRRLRMKIVQFLTWKEAPILLRFRSPWSLPLILPKRSSVAKLYSMLSSTKTVKSRS